MSDSLFRNQVLDAKRSSWLSGIVLTQSLGLWAFTLFAALSVLTAVWFSVLGAYMASTIELARRLWSLRARLTSITSSIFAASLCLSNGRRKLMIVDSSGIASSPLSRWNSRIEAI